MMTVGLTEGEGEQVSVQAEAAASSSGRLLFSFNSHGHTRKPSRGTGTGPPGRGHNLKLQRQDLGESAEPESGGKESGQGAGKGRGGGLPGWSAVKKAVTGWSGFKLPFGGHGPLLSSTAVLLLVKLRVKALSAVRGTSGSVLICAQRLRVRPDTLNSC
eukprot:693919-Rhodomonas_salina.2